METPDDRQMTSPANHLEGWVDGIDQFTADDEVTWFATRHGRAAPEKVDLKTYRDLVREALDRSADAIADILWEACDEAAERYLEKASEDALGKTEEGSAEVPTGPIGRKLLEAIERFFTDEAHCVDFPLEPGSPVFRVNDGGEYVTEEEWERVWAKALAPWWERAWMLADNGQYDFEDVAAMTVAEIEAAYANPNFEPDVAFYTECDDEGYC